MAVVFLALGSNVGDRSAHIGKAVRQFKGRGLKVLQLSSVIETDPQDAPPQGKFLNAVLKAETGFSPQELLDVLQEVEQKLGRVKKTFRGPRIIDIDLLLYDDVKLVTPFLQIPHPRMLERPFVMRPLEEIDPAVCASFPPQNMAGKPHENH